MSEKCIKKEPENATYLDTYAWILYKMKNYNKAREYIERAVKNNKDNSSEIIEHYGDILMVFEDEEGALIQWKKAQKLGKTDLEIKEKIEKAEKKLQQKK